MVVKPISVCSSNGLKSDSYRAVFNPRKINAVGWVVCRKSAKQEEPAELW